MTNPPRCIENDVGGSTKRRPRQTITTVEQSYLRLDMPASVGDVVHEEILREGRLRHDRDFVVEGHQMPRQLPVACSVRFVQDLWSHRHAKQKHGSEEGEG